MTDTTQNPMTTAHLTEDERDDLAQLALQAERRNRPVSLVVFALLVLLITGAAAGLAWRREAQMQRDLAARHAELGRLVDLTAELDQLRTQAASSDVDQAYAPIPDILTRLQAEAQGVGLELSDTPPRREFDGLSGGLRRVRYLYSVETPSAEALLRWARSATDSIPGLRVHRLQVRPPNRRSADRWLFQIDFARIERLDNG